MKKIISLTMVCLLALSLSACTFGQSKDEKVESKETYRSPEDALNAFVSSVKNSDMERILETFTIQNYVEGYDPKDQDAEIIPSSTQDERLVEVYEQLAGFFLGFGIEINEADAQALEDIIVPEAFDTLEVVRIDLPEKEEQTHKDRISNEKSAARIHGAQGWDYRTALISLEGNTYYCGFEFFIYDGNYEIISLSCPMLQLDYRIVTIPCTEDEYLQIINN